jgi:ABC-type Fe3+/spermidine/putrescine transport system ATPase subunit
VTHDQDEATTVADKLAVLRDGRLLQQGEPMQLYRRPADPFVAELLGEANFLPGCLSNGGGNWELEVDGWPEPVPRWDAPPKAGWAGHCLVGIRPENLRVCPGGEARLVDLRLSSRGCTSPPIATAPTS